ncbi:hypothetical protein HK096_009956, partial [Nowakowskiella sp. JEL0078]
PIFDGLRRKKGVLIESVFAFIGIAIQVFGTLGDNKFIAYLAGRLVNQFGVAIAGAVANMYIIEVSHPAWRAFFGGPFGAVWVWGMYASQFVVFIALFCPATSWQWRAPISVQVVWVGILTYMYFHVPESPRFLISRGREEEARKVVVDWMANGDETNPLIENQIEGLRGKIIDHSKWTIKEAYNLKTLFGTANIRRILILITVGPIWTLINAAPTGTVFETNIYKLLGVNEPMAMDIAGNVATVIGAYFGSFGPERYGRCILQVYGYFGSFVLTVISAIGMDLYGRFPNVGWAVLFFGAGYILGFWSSFVVSPLANLFIDEVMPY